MMLLFCPSSIQDSIPSFLKMPILNWCKKLFAEDKAAPSISHAHLPCEENAGDPGAPGR